MKKRIEDPTRPEGCYFGYSSAEECLSDYESEAGKKRSSDFEAIAGYACLTIFLAAVVALSVIAGVFKW